jgi:hypothetical protein
MVHGGVSRPSPGDVYPWPRLHPDAVAPDASDAYDHLARASEMRRGWPWRGGVADEWQEWRREHPLAAAGVTAGLVALALVALPPHIDPLVAGMGGALIFAFLAVNHWGRRWSPSRASTLPVDREQARRAPETEMHHPGSAIKSTANWFTIGFSSVFFGVLVAVNVGLDDRSLAAAVTGGAIACLAFLAFLLVLRRYRRGRW